MVEHEIRKITGPLLIKRLFEIHAPALRIDKEWPRLESMGEVARAKELSDMIRNLAKYDLKQRDRIYAELGTIDIIGSQTRQTEALNKMIQDEPVLNERFIWADFGLPKKKKKEHSRIAHNIAAWINVVAHSKPKSDPEKYSEGAVAAAKRVWDRLSAQAVALSAQEGSCTFFLTPATQNQGKTVEEKAALFETDYKKYRTKITGIENYPAKVDATTHTAFIRFSVNMAADPHLSVQVGDDGSFSPKIDPNADKFKLDYYPGRDYIKMSRVVDRATSLEIAKLFADLMGCGIQDQRKKRCTFDQFDVCRPETLALPKENADRRERVWISAIDSSYLDVNGVVVSKNREYDFPYFENGDIYENLRKIREDQNVSARAGMLAVKRETIGLDLTFELHDYEVTDDGKKLFRDDYMKPIVIAIRPTSNNYLSKIKDLKPYHKNLITEVLRNCDLLPKSRDEVNASHED